MKRKLLLFFVILSCIGVFKDASGQTKAEKVRIIEQAQVNYLIDFARDKSEQYSINKAKAIEIAQEKGWIISKQVDRLANRMGDSLPAPDEPDHESPRLHRHMRSDPVSVRGTRRIARASGLCGTYAKRIEKQTESVLQSAGCARWRI